MWIVAQGYGEGGVFRELQDPPWLLPVVPWYCKVESSRNNVTTVRAARCTCKAIFSRAVIKKPDAQSYQIKPEPNFQNPSFSSWNLQTIVLTTYRVTNWAIKQTVNVSLFILDFCEVGVFMCSLSFIGIDCATVTVLFANCNQKRFYRQSGLLGKQTCK